MLYRYSTAERTCRGADSRLADEFMEGLIGSYLRRLGDLINTSLEGNSGGPLDPSSTWCGEPGSSLSVISINAVLEVKPLSRSRKRYQAGR